ncbi:MAG: FecR domain-containing protein [Sphingobacterium sp.]|jgi:ferric-dicitrate binding protein FerR (iron transport regulator)|nr:FecR domain-containing protein [Sphingobacterium sp.]
MLRFEELYQKYLDGNILETERRELFQLLHDADDERLGQLADSYLQEKEPSELNHLQEDIDRVLLQIKPLIGMDVKAVTKPTRIRTLLRRVGAVAALLIMGILVQQLYQLSKRSTQDVKVAYDEDIAPGGNKAMLTLSDGTSIQLAEDKQELQANKSTFTYEDGTALGTVSAEAKMATLHTPRGGQYRVILPDGTKVVLNAASSLTYPLHFEGGFRKVSVEGEAYFEVAKDKQRPFIVASRMQEITVTGTQFNVNNYSDEPAVATTLIEGQVKIKNTGSDRTIVLKPGEQAVSNHQGMAIESVDPSRFIAWKDDYFVFESMPLSDILRQLSRWYDVEIDYGQVPQEKLSARIKRDKNISAVLNAIAKTSGINFYIKERRIMVKP